VFHDGFRPADVDIRFVQDASPHARGVLERAVSIGGHAEKIGDAQAGPGQGRKGKRLAAHPGQIGGADLTGRGVTKYRKRISSVQTNATRPA